MVDSMTQGYLSAIGRTVIHSDCGQLILNVKLLAVLVPKVLNSIEISCGVHGNSRRLN